MAYQDNKLFKIAPVAAIGIINGSLDMLFLTLSGDGLVYVVIRFQVIILLHSMFFIHYDIFCSEGTIPRVKSEHTKIVIVGTKDIIAEMSWPGSHYEVRVFPRWKPYRLQCSTTTCYQQVGSYAGCRPLFSRGNRVFFAAYNCNESNRCLFQFTKFL